MAKTGLLPAATHHSGLDQALYTSTASAMSTSNEAKTGFTSSHCRPWHLLTLYKKAKTVAKLCEKLDRYYEDPEYQPLYTREVIRYNAYKFASLQHKDDTCILKGASGLENRGMNISSTYPELLYNGKDEICFWTYLEVASELDLPPWEEMELYRRYFLTNLISSKSFMYIRPLSLRSPPPSLPRTKNLGPLYAIWKKSDIHKAFIRGLEFAWDHKSPPGNVDNIVCFGLGALFDSEIGEAYPDSLCRTDPRLNKYRTFLALETAMTLNGVFRDPDHHPPVPIIFHDPDYTQQDRDCMTAFAECVGVQISFMDKCQALLKVDQYTLVLAHGLAQLPIRSLIVDIMSKEEGPAGFFCEDIPSHIKTSKDEVTWWVEHKDHPDPPTRRLHCMTEDWDMEDVCRIPSWQATLYLKRENVGKYVRVE
ncbi:uncharacterized protein J4E88_000978 [Alternaria novae-zelandiae]|uniref:uncharacterized protein n=1 Tax=Alternaria novae-zelandiae TaxID=430562 RepID=UPI0020C2A498|nr:uncharacterized protein J4E88_000978 [Alternaria novae-zelandiae]KAI4696799.1 hypothetical protein J4E88_000978 [Alternaria novae-zelandiae]